MKTVYIHVGLHKTGSTSIQVALSSARSLAGAGVLYPKAGRPEKAAFGHHELAWAVMERRNFVPQDWAAAGVEWGERRRKLFEAVREEIFASDQEKVVLSSEEFDCLAAGEIQSLAGEFNDLVVCPIIYVRNLVDFFESAYKTYIMHSFSTRQISEFVKDQRTRTDIFNFVSDWLSVCKDGQVYLVDYDDRVACSDSLSVFRDCIGVGSSDLPDPMGRMNESSPAGLVEITRHLRSCGLDRERIKDWVSKIGRTIKFDRQATLLSVDTSEALDAKYRDEMEKVFAIKDNRLKVIGSFAPFKREASKIIETVEDAILDIQ